MMDLLLFFLPPLYIVPYIVSKVSKLCSHSRTMERGRGEMIKGLIPMSVKWLSGGD